MKNSGKAYANKKKKSERPIGDFYSTPKSLVWTCEDIIKHEFSTSDSIYEPCSGDGAISETLRELGFCVIENDLYRGGVDYLTNETSLCFVITNPPFSLWDDFVNKAKSHAKKFMFIGRLNYFGTYGRYTSGIWSNLKSIHVFNRYVDYQTPYRSDGLFHVGAMSTGWFLWDMSFFGDPTIHTIDVQKYAKLGNFKGK